ncbi:hypothetical protein PIB30_098103 [Stylosanthes scabra]|uniref:Uncharacterized protein n=1 Tax=Stylosanthes scabra TaxID=79078 RepID=A0ABU6SX37_9FABA|nr:hypothetical protein [Stylosanthes scabra]
MVLLKSSSSSSLVFKVRRNQPELVAPASPTPHELLLLSNLDDQMAVRCHLESVQFFPYNPSITAWEDFIHFFKEALSKTLVFYYPFAGRIREGAKGKLMVDCTGEGVLFTQAEADVTLDQFGSDLMSPFPCFDELFYNVCASDQIINAPLLTFQMTHLKCGGFISAIRMNHTMCDGSGIGQFTKAIIEIAQGAAKPSIMPVWCRELLCERDPPRVTCIHHEYDQLPLDNKSVFKPYQASFFFGPKEIHALRRHLPSHLAESSTTFDILTACLWRCRTVALQWENPNQEVRLIFSVNARHGPCRLVIKLNLSTL